MNTQIEMVSVGLKIRSDVWEAVRAVHAQDKRLNPRLTLGEVAETLISHGLAGRATPRPRKGAGGN